MKYSSSSYLIIELSQKHIVSVVDQTKIQNPILLNKKLLQKGVIGFIGLGTESILRIWMQILEKLLPKY